MRSKILHGIKTGWRQWPIATVVYLLQLGLALMLGLQVHEVLNASIGESLELNKLLHGYDHTVLTDFLKVHGASITPLIGQLRWLLLVWLIFSVFLNGGLLYCAALPEQASVRAFWRNGAMYFFPFLKIALVFLVLMLAWTALLWLPTLVFFQPSLIFFPSEKYTVWLVMLVLMFWLAGLAALFGWSILSRLYYLQTGSRIPVCLKTGFRFFRKNKAQVWSLLLGFTVIYALLVAIYYFFQAHTGMTSAVWVVMFFLVQQTFVFVRIQLRQMLFSAFSCFELL